MTTHDTTTEAITTDDLRPLIADMRSALARLECALPVSGNANLTALTGQTLKKLLLADRDLADLEGQLQGGLLEALFDLEPESLRVKIIEDLHGVKVAL